MRVLLVMAHGSPRRAANSDLYRVIGRLRARSAFDLVMAAFLECNEPSIPDAIDECAANGAKSIVAVPYFLHTGGHVAVDLPEILIKAAQRHPHVEFKLGDYLGRSPRVTDILERRAASCETEP